MEQQTEKQENKQGTASTENMEMWGGKGNVRKGKLLAAVSKVKVGGLGPAEIDLCAICFGFAH